LLLNFVLPLGDTFFPHLHQSFYGPAINAQQPVHQLEQSACLASVWLRWLLIFPCLLLAQRAVLAAGEPGLVQRHPHLLRPCLLIQQLLLPGVVQAHATM
jgi:hypothetical protein